MVDDSVKKLHPLDRIKKLKEMEEQDKKELNEATRKLKDLEEKKKKETAEAEKMIRESEVEITEEGKKKEKVPIAEVASESEEGLSAEARAILRQVRGSDAKRTTSPVGGGAVHNEGAGEKPKRTVTLEETVTSQELSSVRLLGGQGTDYSLPVQGGGSVPILDYDILRSTSEKPMEELYRQAVALYQDVKSSGGYMTPEQQQRLGSLAGGVDLKVADVAAGRYSSWSEDLAEKASVVKSIAAKVGGRLIHEERDWYRGVGQ